MFIFPLLAVLISFACAAVIAFDAVRSPRAYKIVWTGAFLAFAIGAAAKAISEIWEWTPLLAQLFYLSGAVLVVFYLAIGELYLLAGKRIGSYAPGVLLLVTAISAAAVFNASIDDTRIKIDGWQAMDRGNGLGALAAILNAVGTLVLVGGVLYSAWRFKKLGIQRHRMIGLLLIAVGTIMIALGGTATRLGHEEYYYVIMSIGVAIIFAGYLQTRRPDPRSATTPATSEFTPVNATVNGNGYRTNGHHAPAINPPIPSAEFPVSELNSDPVLEFIETHLLPLSDTDLVETCNIWSAEPRFDQTFPREEARRVWKLRCRLSPTAQTQFDHHSVSARLQLAELYEEVFTVTDQPIESIVRRPVTKRRRSDVIRRSPASEQEKQLAQ